MSLSDAEKAEIQAAAQLIRTERNPYRCCMLWNRCEKSSLERANELAKHVATMVLVKAFRETQEIEKKYPLFDQKLSFEQKADLYDSMGLVKFFEILETHSEHLEGDDDATDQEG